MLEKTLTFFKQKKQYVPPEYEEQIEQFDKKQSAKTESQPEPGQKEEVANSSIKQNEIANYEEGIEHSKKIYWPLLFICAVVSDIADIFPVVGTLVKVIVLPIIWYYFYIVLRAPGYLDEKHKIETSYKFRIAIWALGFTDLLTFILPLTTFSVFLVWYRIKKQTREKEKELLEIQQQAPA